MADEGKGGIAAAAGTALAAGGAVIGAVNHSPAPTMLFSGAAVRAESQFASRGIGQADDIIARSADDVANGLGSSSQLSTGAQRVGAQRVEGSRSIASSISTVTRSSAQLRDRQLYAGYTAVVDTAKPQILARFKNVSSPMTKVEIESSLKSDLASAAQTEAAVHPSSIQFEMFTGKLTVQKSYRIGASEITFGEVKLYRVAYISAGGIFICQSLSSDKRGACVTAALTKAFEVSKSWLSVDEAAKIAGPQRTKPPEYQPALPPK